MVPAVTVNAAEVAPAATVTEAGVVNSELLSDSVTVVLAVAALLNVTVQFVLAPEDSVPVLHCRAETVGDVPDPAATTAAFISA